MVSKLQAFHKINVLFLFCFGGVGLVLFWGVVLFCCLFLSVFGIPVWPMKHQWYCCCFLCMIDQLHRASVRSLVVLSCSPGSRERHIPLAIWIALWRCHPFFINCGGRL